MTVLVAADPGSQSYAVTVAPQAEQLLQDRVVDQAEEMECLVLDSRFVGGVRAAGPHQMEQVCKARRVGRVTPLESVDQERLNASHQRDVGW